MAGSRRPDRWRIDMTEQEQLRQLKEEYENMTIPEAGRERLQAGIDRARMEKKRAERARRRSTWTAVAAAAVVLITLPNTNGQIAYAMENIPVLGGFFRLVTVRPITVMKTMMRRLNWHRSPMERIRGKVFPREKVLQ